MKIPKALKLFVCIFMSLFLSHVPALAADAMVPTNVAVADLTRAEATQQVQNFVGQSEVREEMVKRGVDPKEVEARLANLSEAEVKQLAGQIETARAGGDILWAILIVVLIIFIVKRI